MVKYRQLNTTEEATVNREKSKTMTKAEKTPSPIKKELPLNVREDRLDPFFYDQPVKRFVEKLKRPVHVAPPPNFQLEREAKDGEVCARGIYIRPEFPDPEGLIDTAYRDFEAFAQVTKIGGDTYPLITRFAPDMEKESYRIFTTPTECTVFSSDTEGIRRAIIYIEEEMTKNEGPILPYGETVRRAYIKRRITRGFFSPTNRPPKYGDELLDDIEYYPDEYLNRLAHSGTNGLWIYTSFRALVKTDYFDDDVEKIKKRQEKLARVVAKCKKYGVGVYIFAIEPLGLLNHEIVLHPEFAGAEKRFQFHPVCLRSDAAASYVAEATEKLFRAIPDLAGYIDITAGERPTNCASGGNYKTCPKCRRYSRGENLAFACDKIMEGIRRSGTGAQFISWTYGQRYWNYEDISEYIEKLPSDITVMQNFEDRGYNNQLGRDRIAFDYWLSYPGPSELYLESAKYAKKAGKELYAKMQVVTSHELSTVPYIPAPGIVYDKYSAARELGVTGVMECWYFGNYPSVMSRASGALSFYEDIGNKDGFLADFAARVYGKTLAGAVTSAWLEFEKSYKEYPTNIMFSYYGPMHDGVVWELQLLPKNYSLSRSWQLVDKPDGDRIGEALYRGHTLDEALILSKRMTDGWQRGLALLESIPDSDLLSVAEGIGVLMNSSYNILKFYRLRSDLGRERGDCAQILERMREIVIEEKRNSEKMALLCECDSRLGYHSEAEGFKFFPKKLRHRIESLDRLLETEFPAVEARIRCGKHPLGYYYAEGEKAYRLGRNIKEPIGDKGSFTARVEGDRLIVDIDAPKNAIITLSTEFEPGFPDPGIMFGSGEVLRHNEVDTAPTGDIIFVPSAFSHEGVVGECAEEEMKKYSHTLTIDGERAHHTLERIIPTDMWDGDGAFKLNISIDGVRWITSSEPICTLGKEEQSPDEYGFVIK